MATREQATLDANSKRMARNETEMRKPISQQTRPLELLKELPRGKAANETWRPSKTRSKASGR